MTDNFRNATIRRSIALEARHVEALRETLEQLRFEVEELRASRARLVLAADADRREIERELHEGVQQHLIALAVNLQLASRLAATDPVAEKALLEEIGRDVQQALDEAAQLAQRIYPPLLEAGGLASALRAAAASAGIVASVDVAAGASYPPGFAGIVYLSCVEALGHAGAGARATVTVRDEEGALAFEVIEADPRSAAASARSDAEVDRMRDRVEALGGQLKIQSERGRGTRVSGSLPLSR